MFDNMKKSEKILALGVGAVLILGLIFYGTIDFLDQYENNTSRIKSLKKQIQDEQNKMQFAIAASDRQGLFYEKVSFPTGSNQITAYQDWLEKTIRISGLIPGSIGSPKVSKLAFKSDRNTLFPVGKKYNITVVSTGTLNEIIEFCHRFETLDVLQKIRDITLQPLNKKNSNSGQIKATFKIELLAVENADKSRDFQSAYRELPNTLENYKQDIIARNIFGPANNPPSIRVTNKTVEEEEDISVSLSGSDKDKDDELTFEILDDGGIKGAKITASGRTKAKFVGDPMPIGEYVALVKVSDSGFPQKSSEKEFKVVVEKKDEPVVETVKPIEKPPVVLESPSTQFCRINSRIDVVSQTEVFTVKIRNRMRGETYDLQIGDEFELDDKTWTVKDIQKHNLIIEVDGQELEYRFGDFLDKPRNETPIEENDAAKEDDPKAEEDDPKAEEDDPKAEEDDPKVEEGEDLVETTTG